MAGSAVIGALRVNLGIDSAQFSDGLKQAQAGLAKFGALAKKGMMVVGAAAVAVGGAVALGMKNTIDAADDMSKAASKIGIPIEELSKLKYAADLSGVSFEGLQTAVGKLSKNMNEAKNGSKAAADMFQQIGVSATNADGSLKSSSTVMQEIADKFAAMPDGAEKTALAMELMGRAGANMIPMLNGGSAALGSLMDEAGQFGQVFTAEMGTNAEVFNDNISRLQGAFGNLVARLTTQLLPYLAQFTDWMVANAPAIANFIVEVVKFGAAVVQLGVDIVALVTGAWAQFEAAWDGMVAKVHAVKDSIVQFVTEIPGIFANLASQMMEIGAQIMDGLWQGIKGKFAQVKDGIAGFASGLVDSVKSTLGIHSPSRVMYEVGTNVMQGLSDGMTSMQGGVSNIAESIGSTISSAFKGVIDGSKSVKEAIGDVLKSLASMLMDSGFKMFMSGIFGGGGGGGGFLGGLFKAILPGFANGGSFQVGGAGGIDSQVVAFRASPNERVDITKPGQERGGGGVADVRVFVDQDGNWQAKVERISQQTAAGVTRQGIAAYDKQLDRSLGGKIANAQTRQL